jgi:serine protease Do
LKYCKKITIILRPMKKLVKSFAVLILTGMIGGVAGVYFYKLAEKKNWISVNEGTPSKFANYTFKNVTSPSFDFAEVSEVIIPAVVHITTKIEAPKQERRNSQPQSPEDFFQFFNQPNFNVPQAGSGSGVIISSDGYIVTNNHVIDNSNEIKIILNDKRTFDAKVIGFDYQTDLAVLKIEAKDLSFLQFGNSDNLRIGEWVVAGGNPFNLNSTITAGIVSAKARNLNLLQRQYAVESFIQTDAVVNPGNSGGALVNIAGELIGINTAIATQTGAYEGYAFAIPSNLVKKVIEDIMKFGKVQRGLLGIQIGEVTQEVANNNDLDKIQGVLVAGVMENSAAGDAGIKKNDIITKVNDKTVNSMPELQELISRNRPGDKVNLTILRKGKEMQFKVILKDSRGNSEIVSNSKNIDEKILGADFDVISIEEQKKFDIDNGVKVTAVRNGKFKESGIQKGFIITKIDKKNVSKTEDIYDILNSTQGGVLVEGINADGTKGYYGLNLE